MRTNGILCALSSLPSKYGIGSFDKEAYEFVDLLKKAHIKIWQLLPLNPIGFGASPYQSSCGEAIDLNYVSLNDLFRRKLISEPMEFNSKAEKVNYEAVIDLKRKYLEQAFKKQKDTNGTEFKKFIKENTWCPTYALFMVLLLKNNYKEWCDWPEDEKNATYNKDFDKSKYAKDILFYEWCQFILYEEYFELKAYAHEQGILLMGDIPFYVGGNSSDCWSNQDNFLLDKNGAPTFVAGCPPDLFSADGQRWGNPIYDWDFMKDDKYTFWFSRVNFAMKLFDFVRIDHFRAFDTYYMIPSSSPTAKIGNWANSYGDEFFGMLYKNKLSSEIVAEDLGELFPSVGELRDKYKMKGMNILEFTILDPNFKNIPNQIVYTGNHDNDPVVGWFNELTYQQKEQLKVIFRVHNIDLKQPIHKKMIETAFKSNCDYCIIPIQDYLGLDKDARMNLPGTLGSPNWEFKLRDFVDFEALIPYILELVKKYKR